MNTGEIFKNNPHISQLKPYINNEIECKINNKITNLKKNDLFKIKKINDIQRILDSERDPSQEYKRRIGEIKTVIHFGQMKLLLSEIEFLTLYSKPNDHVIYAGAAHGNHINFLSLLFPYVIFTLIDPNPFVCKENCKIRIINDYFTNKMAEEMKNEFGEKILFISDIRTAKWEIGQTPEQQMQVERDVKKDMDMQQEWVRLLGYPKSMLKFRLPWYSGKTIYLKGDIYIQCYGPQTTTETRLIVKDGNQMTEYDNKTYEEQLFFFNNYTRVNVYSHDVKYSGVDCCYDCASMILILSNYIRKYYHIWNNVKNFFDSIEKNTVSDLIYYDNFDSNMIKYLEKVEDIEKLNPNIEEDIRKAIFYCEKACSKERTLESLTRRNMKNFLD